jgi:CubicO group peptidase (beta-lactamase class C family)
MNESIMQTTVRLLAFGLLFLVSTVSHDASGVQAGEPSNDRLENAIKFLQAERGRLGAPGMSAAIVLDNRLAWSGGFGLADVENDVPATSTTVYRIGSVSGTITSIGLLKLIEQGKLTLDASARDYVPEYPDKKEKITVQDLLHHLAGIPSFHSKDEYLNRTHYENLLESLELFKDRPLIARSGEVFHYSTYGYTLLGLVIERVSGVSFGEYVKSAVFDPLGMKATGLDEEQRIIHGRAGGYVRDKSGELRNARFIDVSARYPGAGMVSTAEDLARLAIGFNTGKILSPDLARRTMITGRTTPGQETGYGMGWFLREDGDHRIAGSAGLGSKASSFLLLYPDQDVAVVVIVNLEKTDVIEVALNVGRMLLGYRVGDESESPDDHPEGHP